MEIVNTADSEKDTPSIELPVERPELETMIEKPEPDEVKVFYLSTPNSNGSFNASSANPVYRIGASIYRFEKTGTNTATFRIDERETSLKLALQYPERNIDPVCETSGKFNPNARKIITEPGKEGQALLEGDKWVVKSKAKISYGS